MSRRAYTSGVWTFAIALCAAELSSYTAAASGQPKVTFKQDAGRLDVVIGDQVVATYVYEDAAIPRPYFCQVKTLDGVLVTRPNPPDPVANTGNDDHPAFHPGLWLAFSDVNGKDYWRNKAKVRHVMFIEPFIEEPGRGRFGVVNCYENDRGQGAPVCEETCTYTFRVSGSGYFILVRSEFHSDEGDFAFGDQEEMGLGVRLNTPLTVKFGSGTILNNEGGQNEKGTWGEQSKWCAYSGVVDGKQAGVALMPAPGNFRPSWFHTRDYGLLVANAFGKKSMTGAEDAAVLPDSTAVNKGEPFALAYGVYVFGVPAGQDPGVAQAYNEFLKAAEKE